MKVRHTAHASRDFSGILERFLEVNPVAGVDFVDELDRLESLVADNPEMGRRTEVEGVRELVLGEDYLLPYVVVDDTLWILRIFHAAQDPATKL